MIDERDHILRPYDSREAISVGQAAQIAGKAKRTILEWVHRHKIGRKIVGRVEVSNVALDMLLSGDETALRAYLRGDRASERVAQYLVRAGLKKL